MKRIHTIFYGICFACGFFINSAVADRGAFDFERWDNMISNIREKAIEQKISQNVIDETLKSPEFIPNIIKSDKNQSEFTLTLDEYLGRTVSDSRIKKGLKKRTEYPTLLGKTESKYSVPKNVILAFWGMESNYGAVKSKYQLTGAFLTLIYDGRREDFFTKQLLALDEIHQIYYNLSKQYDIPLLDYSDCYLSQDTAYFYNATHLNKLGAEIFSAQLAHDVYSLGIIQ